MNLASRLAAAPTRAFTESKRLLAESHVHSLQDNLAAEALGQNRAGSTDGHRAAVTAFLAKEKPVFTGV